MMEHLGPEDDRDFWAIEALVTLDEVNFVEADEISMPHKKKSSKKSQKRSSTYHSNRDAKIKSYPSYLVMRDTSVSYATVRKILNETRKNFWNIRGSQDFLELVREEENEYTDKPVAVYITDPRVKIGYLPVKHEWVYDAMNEGKIVEAYIDRIKKVGFFKPRYFVDLTLMPRYPNDGVE